MKVILIAPVPPPYGGIASWTKRMLETNLSENWTIDVVDSKIIGNRSVFASEKKNIITESKRLFSIWYKLWNKLSDKEIKVVHSCIPAAKNSMIREIVCMLISKIRGKKFIIHYRCTLPNIVQGKLGLYLFRILNKFSDSIIVLNTESLVFVDYKNRDKAILIPNFIDTESTLKEKKEINKELSTVIYVGGITEEKGSIEIIKVAKHFPKIDFVMIGEGNSKINDISTSSNVKFLGARDKEFIKEQLKMSDVFLFPSFYRGEGFSNSLVEAMAMGLPCIVSDWAANKDMIQDKGGVVVPIKNEKKIEEALNLLSSDWKIRREMSEWNLSKVKKSYIDKVVIKQYIEVYNNLIKDVTR